MQYNKSHVPFVWINLNVNQQSKWVSLFVGSYKARFSTYKINDKIQNAKTSWKYKTDLTWNLKAGDKIEALFAPSKIANTTN